MGWKMVYNFPGIDEKTQRNLLTFDQNVRTVYSNIHAVNPNKNHVTTHPVQELPDLGLLCLQVLKGVSMRLSVKKDSKNKSCKVEFKESCQSRANECTSS